MYLGIVIRSLLFIFTQFDIRVSLEGQIDIRITARVFSLYINEVKSGAVCLYYCKTSLGDATMLVNCNNLGLQTFTRHATDFKVEQLD